MSISGVLRRVLGEAGDSVLDEKRERACGFDGVE